MENKIKKIFLSLVGITVVALLGFAPVAEKKSAGAFTVRWGNLGAKMVEAGVIDAQEFERLYTSRGGLSEADLGLLYGGDGDLAITQENAGVALNLLWAFGLANKNRILTEGPMMTYSGAHSPAEALAQAGNFASTGGWTLAKGSAMDHYSMHEFVTLTPDEQALVEKVTKNIYRPCCGNSAYFPDCNHGMAMLGLMELMAAQGATEAEMYQAALEANTLWFPDTYAAIKTLFGNRGIDWNTVDPKEIVGVEYSSASGFQKVLLQIEPQQLKGGGSCGA